ncbi:MAG: hypothetical protein EOO14_24735, partial [Chitinophagaceae bacterium]
MTSVENTYTGFNSVLSILPLVTVIKRMVDEDKPGAKKLYQDLLTEIEAQPELLQPSINKEMLHRHEAVVEALLATIFPPSVSSNQGMYAITFPFSSETIYASPSFKRYFLKDGTAINVSDRRTTVDIAKASLSLAYNVILRKLYAASMPLTATSVHAFPDEENNLTTYYELNLNAEFVDVECINKEFKLPAGFSPYRTLE